MNSGASNVLRESERLYTIDNRNFLSGITENGEKVEFDHETWLSKSKTHCFTALFINSINLEEGDVSKLKSVLGKSARLYIKCGRFVPNVKLRFVLDLLTTYSANISLFFLEKGYEDSRDVFIKDLLELNLSFNLAFTDSNYRQIEKTKLKEKMKLKERLSCVIKLYESNMKILSLNLWKLRVISSSMAEWQRLKNLIQEKGCTLEASLSASKFKGDLVWLKSFLSTFSLRARLNIFNDADMLMYYIDCRPLFKRSEMIITFGLITATIDELSAELVKVHNLGLEETATLIRVAQPSEKTVLAALLKSMNILTNIVQVTWHRDKSVMDLSNNEAGRGILAILDSRYAAKVKQLIESDKKGALNRTKLMVVGAGGAGKTSCCRALLGAAFVKEHLSTVVADGSRDLFLLDVKDINISEAWKELPNDEENFYIRDFDALRRNIVRDNNKNVMIQEKMEEKSKKEEILQIMGEGEKESKNEYSFEERISRILRRKENDQLSTAFDVEEFEKRARGMKLTLWDFGGQAVFDAAHHFYLSNQGVVLLVFNVENWINHRNKEEQNIKKWLASLMFYSPNSKVLLVGTRAGAAAVPEVLQEVSEALDELHHPFDDVEVIENEVDDLFFFPVENSEPDRNKKLIHNLRETIKTVLQDPKAAWKKEVPLSWLFFMHLIDSEDKNVTSLSEVFTFAQAKGFSKEEVRELLKFFTEAGSIVSFEERFRKLGNRAELVDDTVLKPKWLLKSLACFLFDDIHVKSKRALYKLGKGMKSKVFLLMNGFLSKDLLHKILNADKSPRKQREAQFLEKLCELMLVISPVDQISRDLKTKVNQKHLKGDEFWLLPSMLNRKSNVVEQSDVSQINDQAITVNWESVTPQGLFERFVASFCKVAKGKQGLQLLSISSKLALLELRDVRMELRKNSLQEFRVSFSPGTQLNSVLVNEIMEEVLTQIRNLEFESELVPVLSTTVAFDETEQDISINKSIPTQNTVLEWDFDCFLSHSWGDYPDFETHNQVLRIAARLKREGLKVWVDANELNATVAGELHRGIDGSASFIAFVTKKYLKSADDRDNNAGKEFNYAALKNGADTIIPVLLDPEFSNPKDWRGNVGIHLGNALYVDFTSAVNEEENMNRLCVRIKKLSMRKRQRRKIDE